MLGEAHGLQFNSIGSPSFQPAWLVCSRKPPMSCCSIWACRKAPTWTHCAGCWRKATPCPPLRFVCDLAPNCFWPSTSPSIGSVGFACCPRWQTRRSSPYCQCHTQGRSEDRGPGANAFPAKPLQLKALMLRMPPLLPIGWIDGAAQETHGYSERGAPESIQESKSLRMMLAQGPVTPSAPISHSALASLESLTPSAKTLIDKPCSMATTLLR